MVIAEANVCDVSLPFQVKSILASLQPSSATGRPLNLAKQDLRNKNRIRAGLAVLLFLSLCCQDLSAKAGFIPDYSERVLASANTVKLKAKWAPVLDRSQRELRRLEQGEMKYFFTYVRLLSKREQIHYVNRWVNERMGYERDVKGRDQWQSVGQSVARGRGDCEDFSIAKYAILRYLGHDAGNMMLVGGVSSRQREKHIVLYVRQDANVLALDALRKVVAVGEHTVNFRPVFGFREQVARLYLFAKYLSIASRESPLSAKRG